MIDRRTAIKSGVVAVAVALVGRPTILRADEAPTFAPQPGAWRTFEIRTRVDLPATKGAARVWVPTPGFSADGWTKPEPSTFTGNATQATLVSGDASLVMAEWKEGAAAPVLEVTSRVQTRDRAVDLGQGGATLSAAERAKYLAPTELIPTDGIVAAKAKTITAGAATDRAKALAIYDWVVENAFRDAAVRGCGIGDVASMLETGYLGGKCADLNALYVGLARAAGLPARDVYGIRVAPSRFGYKSLGANSQTITKSQHCRAEVWLDGPGWVPVDPADVRKVALEEPPANRPLTDPKVAAARKTLFGAWEGNWMAYNDAHDVALPGSDGPKLGFLMYPQAETAAGRLDCLDPDAFKYVITTREIVA